MKKNHYTVTTLLLLLSALLITPTTPAAANAAQDKQKMDDIVVTGTRTEERAIDVPVTTQVITAQDIEMSGATDIGDLIGKYVTGHYHKYNGLLSPIGMRGFRTESHGDDLKGYVLILVDGHRIGTGNAAKINVDRIERVEITKGPSSALYGSAAMGGVINIITKTGNQEANATIGLDYGSFGNHKFGLSAGGEINAKLRLHVSASMDETGDYDAPKYGTVYNTAVSKKNFGGNIVYTLNDRHEFRFGGNFADLSSESPSWENGTYSTYDEDNTNNNDKNHGYADLEYRGDYLGNALSWNGVLYYLWDRNHWNYGYPNGAAADYQSKYTDTTIGIDQQFTWNMASWNKLLIGFTLEQLKKKSEAVSGGVPSTPYTPGMTYNSQALFLQDSLDLWNNHINLIGAVRYDRFDVSTQRPETGTWNDYNEVNAVYDHISPKIGAGYKFWSERIRVRANLGQGFKSPSADQLSADYVHSNGRHYLGNADLNPETSLTYDVGADLMLDALTVNVGYYHSDYEDKIVSYTYDDNGVNTTSYKNIGGAEMAGIDVGFEWYIGRMFDMPVDVTLRSNITFNTSFKDNETNEDLLYMSDYEAKSVIDVSYHGVSSQLSHVLVGPQMITNYDTNNDEEKKAFDFWDLTLRYRFNNNWEIRGSILNLLDQEVEWVRGHLMAERNYRVGVSYTFR